MLRKLLIIIISILIIFGVYQFAKAQNWISDSVSSKIDAIIPNKISLPWNKDKNIAIDQIKVNKEDLDKLGEDGLFQIQILANKAKEAGSVAQEFVEEVVQVDESSDKNVSEKAFDYGRYIYCQEVVKQYEVAHNSSEATDSSSMDSTSE